MEVQVQRYEVSDLLKSLPDNLYTSPLRNTSLSTSKIDETQLINSVSETAYQSPSPSRKTKSSKMEVDVQKFEELVQKHLFSSPLGNRTVKSQSIEASSSPATKPRSTINNLIKAVFRDNKSELISLANASTSTSQPFDRSIASRLLHVCCEFDSVNSAAALLNGDVCGVVPLINDRDISTGYAPLHTAAENHSLRCIELLLRKRGRTYLKTKKAAGSGTGSGAGSVSGVRSLLPLELSLRCVRVQDIKWGPDDPLDDLLLMLSEKNLGAVRLLSERTNEIGEVAYSVAMEGRVTALAALLMVAADKINGSVLTVRNPSDVMAENTTVYSCVIREAISVFTRSQGKGKDVDENDNNMYRGVGGKERRKLLLREMELLHFFGATYTNSGCLDKKVTPPLVLASQAGDEAVMKFLLKTDIDVNEADTEGNSPLHWSIKASKVSSPEHIRILLLLLKHGAKLRQKDKWGLTAVHIAAANGNLEALEILLSRDPDSLRCTSELKETALFLAVKNDLVECVQLLMRYGASTDVHNLRRERPIELAKSQQMRSALNRTSVVITNRASQQKIITRVQNDEVVSETYELLLRDTCSSSESVNSSSDGDICKYYLSAAGCSRGSKCFYKHGEEELVHLKSRASLARYLALEEFKRKIFVGGLPISIDSESLASVVQEQFGTVLDAKVLEMEIDGQVLSRGFGFVTFKDEKSVAAALEAHYTYIWGKKVEMKTAIPKCLLSQDDSEDDPPQEESLQETRLKAAQVVAPKAVQVVAPKAAQERTQETVQQEKRQSNCHDSSKSDMSVGDNKPDQLSWAGRVAKPQPVEPVNQRKAGGAPSGENDKPKWFRTLQHWLPKFLKKMSINAKPGEYYSLSSVKSDFKSIFGLNLDHASLGYAKLSDFIKSNPGLCSMKYINTGGNVANHMILLPPKNTRPPPQIVSKKEFPVFATTTPSQEHNDADGTASNVQKSHVDAQPSEHKDVGAIKGEPSTLSGNISPSRPDATAVNKVVGRTDSSLNPKETEPAINKQFLQFLEPDPIFLGRTWLGTGGFKSQDDPFRPKHSVLEHLAEKKNEVFFLRDYSFYDDYAASCKRANCFGCGNKKLVWANFPCQHLLWCSDCKNSAMMIAELGSANHKCVVCNQKVLKIDFMPSRKFHLQSYDDAEFPPVQASCLRN